MCAGHTGAHKDSGLELLCSQAPDRTVASIETEPCLLPHEDRVHVLNSRLQLRRCVRCMFMLPDALSGAIQLQFCIPPLKT